MGASMRRADRSGANRDPACMYLKMWTNSLGPRGVYLALASIQCVINFSIAPESLNSKSAGCKAVTLGEIELFTF